MSERKNIKKRIRKWHSKALSFVLMLSMVLSVVVLPQTTASAATYSGGSGTSSSPYLISTVTDWQTFCTTSSDWGKHFKLTADITVTGSGANYYGVDFSGTFDGDGHTISLGYQSNSTQTVMFKSLFNSCSGTIKNLDVKSYWYVINNSNPVGGIVGTLSGTLQNCYSSGCTAVDYSSTTNVSAGGLVGTIASGGKMLNCYSAGASSNTGGAGGLAYEIKSGGQMISCYSMGSVTVTSGYGSCAGLAYINAGTITACYNRSSVQTYTSSIPATLVYYNSGTIKYCYDYATSPPAYNITNNSNGTTSYTYGGYLVYSGGTVTNCYTATSNISYMYSNTGTTITLANLKDESYILPLLNAGGTYYAIDSSVNSGLPYLIGTGGYTNVPPTFSGSTSFTKTYGNAAFSLGQSVNSGGTLTYSSDNTNVATVDSTGKVTIVGVGTATITVKAAAKGSYRAGSREVTVTVNAASPTFSGSTSFTKTYGDAAFSLGQSVNSGGTLTYSSNNTNVATVDTSGNVTIKGAGTATIAVSAAAKGNYAAGSRNVTVKVNTAAPTFSGSTSFSKTYGNAAFSLGQSVNSGGTLTYSSDNTSVATVDTSGNVTIKGAGTATITVSAAAKGNYSAGSRTVTVTVAKASRSISVATTSHTKNYGDASFNLGATITAGSLAYSSSNTNVAAVDSSGNVTIKGVGTATITISSVANANYNDAESKTVTITVNGVVPYAPTGLTAKSGENGKVSLSWTAPTFTGGLAITGYVLQRSTDGNNFTTVASPTATSYSDTNVTNGTTYYFRVAAVNSKGTGTYSSSLSAKPYTVSGVPKSVSAKTTSNASVALSWEAPESNGGDAISSYLVKAYSDSSLTTQVSSATVNPVVDANGKYTTSVIGLAKGTTYYFTVAAVNAAGTGTATSVVSATTWTDPLAPQNVIAKAVGKGTINVSWEAPAFDGGTPITGYILSYRKKGITDWTQIKDITETSYDVTGLTVGYTYEFKVAAVNASNANGGTASDIVEAIASYKPDAPVLGQFTSKNASALLNQIINIDSNGADVTKFVVYYREKGEADFEVFTELETANSSLYNVLFEGLENGKEYEFAATAVNNMGESDISGVKSVLVGLPTTPENLLLTPKTGQMIDITFDPSDGQGNPILGYDLYIGGTKNGEDCEVEKITITDTYYEYNAGERLNGDIITVYVIARNIVGESEETDTAIATIGAPTAPVLTKYDTDVDHVSFGWTAALPNGNALMYYTVYITDANGDTATFKTANATTLEMDVTTTQYDFTPGMKYIARVTATNTVGESIFSNAGEFTFGAPARTESTIIPGDGSLTVSWTKPENNGGYEIVGYRIYLNDDIEPTATVTWNEIEGGYQLLMNDHRNNKGAVEYGAGQDNLDAFTVVITGLANGQEYTATVKAINEMGEGPGNPTDPEIPNSYASAPLNVTATGIGATQAQVSWKKPLSDGGSSITGYSITAYKVAQKNYDTLEYDNITRVAANTYTATETSLAATGLEAGYAYEFEVSAITAAGNGDEGVSNIAYTHTKPSKPVITELESGVGTAESLPLTVRWTAPVDDGNSEIIGYDIYVNDSYKMNTDGIIPADKTEYVINDSRLKNGTTYSVTVIAYNAVTGTEKANGVASDAQSILLGSILAPRDIQLSGDRNGNLTVTWSMDQYAGIEKYIDRFVIYINDAYVMTTKTNTAVATSRPLGVPQKVQVSVINTFSQEGNKSKPKTITLGAPDKVENVVATAGMESAEVTWNAVNPDDAETDFAVTGYTVYADGHKVAEVASSDLKASLTGLEGGRTYEITVTATNKYGEGIESDKASVMPWSKPDCPVVNKITTGVGKFSFTFDEPDGNGAAITGYNVYVDGVQVAAQFDGTKATVTGVTDGVKHEFCITAINAKGLESDKPVNYYYVTTGVPEAPKNVKALAGIESATVSFDKSEDVEGYPVTGYEILCDGEVVKEVDANTTTADIYGLTDGHKYKFTVRAVNAIGTSEESGAAYVIPGTPRAPVIDRVVPQSKKITLTWTKPQENSAKITKYIVYVDGVQVKTTSQTQITLSDLENGQQYEIAVSAYNSIGEGALSEPVNAIPGGVPGVVTDVEYEATYAEDDGCGFILKWNEPEDNGGLAITEYKVTGEGEIVVDSTNMTATITGLSPDATYSYEIIAVSAAGEGEAYDTGDITTLSTPDAPTITGISSSNNTIYVTWQAPVYNGGADIISYNVYAKAVSGSDVVIWNGMPTVDENGEYAVSVTGDLITNQYYVVSVAAVNIVGEGEPSSTIKIQVNGEQVQTVPSAPINLTAHAGDEEVTLTWSAPVNDGNSSIKKYHIWAGNSTEDMGYIGETDGYTFTYTETGLKNEEERFYKIKAINSVSVDGGDFSDVVSATPTEVIPPMAPTWPAFDNETGISAYEVNAQGTQMIITWNASTGDESGGEITYEVYVNNELKTATADTSYILTDLDENTGYNIWIKAINELGASSVSKKILAYKTLNIRKGDESEGYVYEDIYKNGIYAEIDSDYDGTEDTIIIYGTPSAPLNANLTRAAKSVTVVWNPPASDGNKEILGYNVYVNNEQEETVSADQGVSTMSLFDTDSSSAQYSYNFDIEYGNMYTVYVKAYNSIGEGDATQIMTVSPSLNAPYNLSGSVRNKTDIELTWNVYDNDATSYLLYVNGVPQEIDASDVEILDSTVTYTYSGIINKIYNFSVSSKYDNAESVLSNIINVSTHEEKISAPLNVSVANVDSEVTVTWEEPENASVTDIEYYKIYVNGEEFARTESTECSAVINITETCVIKVAAVCEHGITGEMSVPIKYVNPVDGTFGIDTPGAPTNVEYTLERNDGILATDDNITITWETAPASEDHTLISDSFNIYSGNTLLGNTTENEFTWTVEPGKDYYIRIEPLCGDVAGPKAGEIVSVPENEYSAPEKPVLYYQVNDDKTEISLTWKEEEGVLYYITLGGEENPDPVTSGYVQQVIEGTVNYVFTLRAVKTYEDGAQAEAISDPLPVCIEYSGTYQSNPPVITRTLSYEMQTKVFWIAPTEKLENEFGEIDHYAVVIDGIEVAEVNASDDLVYTIDFESVTDSKEVVIKAYKIINGNTYCSATSEPWIATPNCNIVPDEDTFDNPDDDEDVDNPDRDGDGIPDDVESVKTILIPVTVNAKEYKAEIAEYYDIENGKVVCGNVLKTVTPTTDENGNDFLEVELDSSFSEDMVLCITIKKDAHTKYFMTQIPFVDLANVVISDAQIFFGDLDGDGIVNTHDKTILGTNRDIENPTLAEGDIDASGGIGSHEFTIISTNRGKMDIIESWSN